MAKGHESGPYHGLPEKLSDLAFTLVRPAPEWYRSVWWHMYRDNWIYHTSDSPVWNYLQRMVIKCKDSVFEQFIFNICADYPGIYSWVVSSLAPPGVKRIQLSEAADWLMKNLDVYYVDRTPIDVTPSPPDISDELRKMIGSMEYVNESLIQEVPDSGQHHSPE